jgi:orotidine-5'-phosphate decarboxylase
MAEAFREFGKGVIDAVASLVPAIKPQSAFFELLGPPGMQVLGELIQHARSKGLIVILDAKRNDIGTTAQAYADAYLGPDSPWGADALTVSPFLGDDSLVPFVAACDRTASGLFVLVKTSNPGSGFLQDLAPEGQSISNRIAHWVQCQSEKRAGPYGLGPIGAVVGATYPSQLAALRERMRSAWILIPGYGAQGGAANDVAPAFLEKGLGALVNSSRAIIFAHQSPKYASCPRWQDAVVQATQDMNRELRATADQRLT